ncbi:unnamed protein product [Orchesella dallaii]|uniref:Uncharacterized protein n=1 Tax=Orchesella dallaii TaxID=48710 RepID=A0ABP1QXU2_9HEXA
MQLRDVSKHIHTTCTTLPISDRNGCRGLSLRDKIFQSERKIKGFQLLLEELAQPEVNVAEISHHTSTVINMIRQQNLMMIPKFLEQIDKQREPLVLEISRRKHVKRLEKAVIGVGAGGDETSKETGEYQSSSLVLNESENEQTLITNEEERIEECPIIVDTVKGNDDTQTNVMYEEAVADPPLMKMEESLGEKQFEIIFSDSTQQTEEDVDNGNRIIYSITERSATAEHPGTVNVPNSFPLSLFQLVHTDVPENMQQDIVKLIREANPQLDLNSITFNFKSPQTVEIIANVNS